MNAASTDVSRAAARQRISDRPAPVVPIGEEPSIAFAQGTGAQRDIEQEARIDEHDNHFIYLFPFTLGLLLALFAVIIAFDA